MVTRLTAAHKDALALSYCLAIYVMRLDTRARYMCDQLENHKCVRQVRGDNCLVLWCSPNKLYWYVTGL